MISAYQSISNEAFVV
jgi:hypothetical protein